MDLNLTQDVKKLITLFLLILIPLILIGLGAILGLANALYYILSIIWFGMGVIFFSAIY